MAEEVNFNGNMFAIYGPNTVGKVPQFYIFICNFLPIVG